ncbi:hypothetical protein RJ641_004707 [Dillenia turbinata]|uniref:WW domain-containing protein n=1 Tax=Dillenia turbinata TaxID=194707 RepID=A0AAN8VMX2_9MAGN
MMKELVQQDQLGLKEENVRNSSQQFYRIMELPELTLAPSRCVLDNDDNYPSKKRKSFTDHQLFKGDPVIQTSVDLQLKDPLPADWEQCLDLESGRMYYLNRKTLRKSWNWPKDQKLDLELNISTIPARNHVSEVQSGATSKANEPSNNSNMVALACLNCHLLVILSKASPSCPNCKYVHSLPMITSQQNHSSKPSATFKSLDTLTLLN